MAQRGNSKTGWLVAAGALAIGFGLVRQAQATTTALTSARLTGFELKGWSGTTLSALAQVEFNNSHVTRDVQLQELGLNVSYNGTTLGTAHLTDGRTLARNQNTTLPIPVTVNVGSLLAQLALTGKVPALATFTSLSKVVAWLQQNIGTEELRLQGTAKVNGVVVDFDQPLNMADYLPAPARQKGEQPLPTRQTTVRQPTSAPGASVPSTVRPTRVQQVTTTVQKAASTAQRAGTLVRDTTAAVTTAVQRARAAAGARKPRPTNQGKATASKGRKAGKPPKAKSWDAGLPKVNLPTTKRGGGYQL